MKKHLVFDYIATHRLHFNGDQNISKETSYNLFTPEDSGIEDKVIDKNEEQILKWFMNSEGGKFLLAKLGFTNKVYCSFSVREPVVKNSSYSDIDLILCELNLPQFSIGIQCKRVKVESMIYNKEGEKQEEINKLSDIKKAVVQVNKQREHTAFHRNYLLILSQIFGRNFTQENTLFRKPSQETQRRIYEFPQKESLNEDVGIIFVEIVQPTGETFRNRTNIGICIDKEAARIDQTSILTKSIEDLLKQLNN